MKAFATVFLLSCMTIVKIKSRAYPQQLHKSKVLHKQSQLMNSPCGDPNKELNHKEEKPKVDQFPAVWQP